MVTARDLKLQIKRVYVTEDTDEPKKVKTVRTKRKDYEGNGHWSFDKELGQGKYFGFIYVIRDLETGKSYIGKKQYKGSGKLNRGVVSNWQWYVSSSKVLSETIKAKGKESFEFIVLDEYKTRGGLSFAETWSLVVVETPSNPDKWYNVLINKVTWRVKEPVTLKHRERLNMVVNGEMLPIVEHK
jgi:archaellum biogenesis ATPase FlaH